MSGYADMPSTIWTVIAQARRQGGPALEALLRKYRLPVLSFLRGQGFGIHEAEDLAQEVFLVFVKDDVLARVDSSKGRFRNLLLAVTRHVIQLKRRNEGRLKRGGDRRTTSLDEGGFPVEEILSAPHTDPSFDPLWIQNLLRIAMSRLQEECAENGTPYFQALFLQSDEELSYPAIAERLGATVTNVKNYLHQGRLRMKRFLLQEIRSYSSTRAEYEEEIAYLMKLLEEPAPPASGT